MMDINFTKEKEVDNLFSKFPNQIKSLQWHSYEVQGIQNHKDVTLLASSPVTKFQIFKYQNHAYGIQFHIEIKNTTVNEWGCIPEYKKGEWCNTMDGLYWRFIDRNRKFFLTNPRLSMMVRIFDKMKTDRKKLILSEADKFIKQNTI
jgi:GMP synthase-like glutamine amidotransferase